MKTGYTTDKKEAKMEKRLLTGSVYERVFEDSETLEDFFYFKPGNLFLKKVFRFLTPTLKRKKGTYEDYRNIISYLSLKKIINISPSLTIIRNDLPTNHGVRISHSESIYGWWAEYGNTTGRAFAVAIGELLERFFSSGISEENTRKDTRGVKYVPLHNFNLFLDEQTRVFPILKTADQESYQHELCVRLYDNKKFLIPSQFIFWSVKRDKNILTHQTTNGGGAFYSREEALLSGIYELIHRDNFLLTWLTMDSTKKKIDLNTIKGNSSLENLITDTLGRGLELTFLDISFDIDIPCVASIIVDKRNGDAVIGVGGAAGNNAIKCLESALRESLVALQTNLNNEEEMFDFNNYTPFLDTGVDRRKRLSIWKKLHDLKKISFLFSGELMSFNELKSKERKFKNKKEELRFLINIIRIKGEDYEVYA